VVTLLLAMGMTACGALWNEEAHEGEFPLRGQHVGLPCEACHTPGSDDLPTACMGCHEAERPVPHDPGDCGECHTEDGWGTVDHSFFPLLDAHDIACVQCHTNGGYTGLDAACASCGTDSKSRARTTCSSPRSRSSWAGRWRGRGLRGSRSRSKTW